MSVNIDGCDDLFICDDLNIHNLKFIILSVQVKYINNVV